MVILKKGSGGTQEIEGSDQKALRHEKKESCRDFDKKKRKS
jgi:hypothetical protein